MKDERFSVPLFTVREAARHLGVPPTTLRNWLRNTAAGAPLVHGVEPESPRGPSMPFIAAVETHVLQALKGYGLHLREIAESVKRLRRELGTQYALASRDIATDGVAVLVNMARSSELPQWERARDGQRPIDEIIQEYLRYVIWAGSEYPVRLKLPAYEEGADVILDPRFDFGQPVLESSKIPVADVLDVYWAGEPYEVIAREYGLTFTEVAETVRIATRLRAA